MRIVGYHASNGIIANSDGGACIQPPFLDFLLEQKPDTIKVFYHMGYNIANLAKMIDLTEREARILLSKGQLYIAPYTLKHAPNRFLSVAKGFYKSCPFANFGDMSQYQAAELSEQETVEGCIGKAKRAQATGEEVYRALTGLGLHPVALTSPVRAFEKEVLSKMGLPTVSDMPEEAGYYAYQCCKGNWLEAFQTGYWEQAWDYDINSAYGMELARLPDLRGGEWQHTDGFYEDGLLGYYKGKVSIKAPFSPIIYTREGTGFDSLNYTPVGTWETYLTKEEIDFIYKWDLGTFEIEDGWYWELTEARRNILEGTITWLHQQKEEAIGLEREIIKRIMAGIWGKFLEVRRGDFGRGFNPVYGAEVETNIRLKVAELALQSRIVPIHIAVDGMLLGKPVMPNIRAERENRLGHWRQNTAAPCIVAGTGVAAVKGKEKTGDFSLDYDWLKGEIERRPEEKEYKVRKMSPITLAVALQRNWEKLGQLHEITRIVDIGSEMKRCYKGRQKSGGELLDRQCRSEPWDMSLVSKLT